MRIIGVIVCAVFLALAGCDSKKKRHSEMMLQTPLELDPTEHHDFDGWWSNGREMLHLDVDAAYQFFATTNQYSQPIQRGRWSQQNYATLWLEPYSELTSSRVRVTVMKTDGQISISLPQRAPFSRINAPPPVLEDRLVGRWTGPVGNLNLTSTMRYTLAPEEKLVNGEPSGVIVGHRGTWALANQDLVLQPDAGAVQAMRWTVIVDGQDVWIDTPGGAMTRASHAR
jgi:hypothetical protein